MMKKLWWIGIGVCVLGAVAPAQERFKLLATSRAATMEDEMNKAGAAGYRYAGTQGGETAFGNRETVIVMELDPEGRRYRFVLLSTSRTGTMEKELNEVPPEFEFVEMTLFEAAFAGKEAAVILQAEMGEQ